MRRYMPGVQAPYFDVMARVCRPAWQQRSHLTQAFRERMLVPGCVIGQLGLDVMVLRSKRRPAN